MTFANAWNAVVHAIAALLLTLVVATPAVAEIACADDGIAHVTAPLAGDADHAAVSQEDPARADRDLGQPGHCGFSHGHCAGMLVSGSRGEPFALTEAAYIVVSARPMPALSPDAPERPPSA